MTGEEVQKVCGVIRQTGFEMRRYLRNGHLEKLHENAMVHRLRKAGVKVQQQVPLRVYDKDGTVLGHFAADLLIEDSIVVELKATRALADEHTAQLLGYLRASRLEHGMLCNFGAPKHQVRKCILPR